MSKQNLTSEQIIENILRPQKNKKSIKGSNIVQETQDEIKQAANQQNRKKRQKDTIYKPQNVTIVLGGNTYAKLQKHIVDRRVQGDRSFSISKLARELIEEWVEENIAED